MEHFQDRGVWIRIRSETLVVPIRETGNDDFWRLEVENKNYFLRLKNLLKFLKNPQKIFISFQRNDYWNACMYEFKQFYIIFIISVHKLYVHIHVIIFISSIIIFIMQWLFKSAKLFIFTFYECVNYNQSTRILVRHYEHVKIIIAVTFI